MLEPCNLLIDVGNTRLKYAIFKVGDALSSIEPQYLCIDTDFRDALNQIFHTNKIANCLCSCVGHAQTLNTIERISIEAKASFNSVQTRDKQQGLINAYTKPENMGVDRWLAMLGARALQQGVGSQIVVDAGTAITVDFVEKDKHLGGWICAGLELARSAIVSKAPKVFDVDSVEMHFAPGTDTPNCVASGAMAQAVGIIHAAHTWFEKRTIKHQILLTGGDSKIISECLSLEHRQINNLVLVGLAIILESDH